VMINGRKPVTRITDYPFPITGFHLRPSAFIGGFELFRSLQYAF